MSAGAAPADKYVQLTPADLRELAIQMCQPGGVFGEFSVKNVRMALQILPALSALSTAVDQRIQGKYEKMKADEKAAVQTPKPNKTVPYFIQSIAGIVFETMERDHRAREARTEDDFPQLPPQKTARIE